MDDGVRKMLIQVERLLDMHRKLLMLCEEQKRFLIAGQIMQLNAVVQQMERCVQRITELEKTRLQTACLLADEFSISLSQVNVSWLMGRTSDENMRKRLQGASTELQNIMMKMMALNMENSQLTSQSLSYISKTVELVVTGTESPAYGRKPEGRIGAQFINVTG